MKLLLASNNAKKRAELTRILAALSLDAGDPPDRGVSGGDCAAELPEIAIFTPSDLGLRADPIEDGATFEQNAQVKARAFAALTPLPVLADDSGLCVDALRGAPGVRSARFAGKGASDVDNRARLLAALEGVPAERRTARFVCSLVLMQGDRVVARADGACDGRILERERGSGGFGYDPLFLHEPSGETFAEMSDQAKDRVSHRGHALRSLLREVRGRSDGFDSLTEGKPSRA